jgi:hypothetical protein
LFVININSIKAQQVVPCGFDANREELIQNFGEEFLHEENRINEEINSNQTLINQKNLRIYGENGAQNNLLYIPVVFHNLSSAANLNTLYQQCTTQITALNSNFASPETHIRFCLAQKDINGQQIGINGQIGMVNYTPQGILGGSDLQSQTQVVNAIGNNTNLIPSAKYLNVFIYDAIAGNVLAFAPNPITSQFLGAFSPLDGVVISKNVLGDESSGNNFGLMSDFNLGKTLVHEVGHYLFLLHTFQGECSTPGDYCSDTQPCYAPTNSQYFDCDSNNPYEGCSIGFNQKNNHMNYSFDNCKNDFTPIQIERMNTFLTTQRSQLISNENMITSGINLSLSCSCPDNFLVPSFSDNNTQNQFCANLPYTFTNFNSSYNSAISYNWEIFDLINSGASNYNVNAATNSSIQVTFTNGSVFRIKLTVTDIIGNQEVSSRNIRVSECSGPVPISDNSKANWYFGQMAKISFNSGIPQMGIAACTNPHLNVSEAVESVSDANGNLLFYTDGFRFWNNNEQLVNQSPTLFEIIPDMGSEKTKSVSQKVIVKHLGYENRYFIISPPERTLWEDDQPLYRIPGYKQINANDVNNLIISAGQPIITNGYFNPPADNIKYFSELITYVPTCNNTGWIIYVLMNNTKPANQNNCRIAAQRVNSGGLVTTELIYSESFNWSLGTSQMYPSFGAIKCSPDGRRLVIGGNNYSGNTPKGRLCVLDFNPATGHATNPMFISENNQLPGSLDGTNSYYFYSPSFAPNNSNLIYCTVPVYPNSNSTYTLLKFNVIGANSYCSTFLNDVNGNKCFSLQTGPDDIMYTGSSSISQNSQTVVSSIHNADNFNAAVFVAADLNFATLSPVCNGYSSGTGMVRAKLPNFSDFKGDAQLSSPTIQYLLTSCNEVIFDVQPLLSCANINYEFNWNFGDGYFSSEVNPTHTYSSASGNYNVSVTISSFATAPITLNTVVTIINPSLINIVQSNGNGTITPGTIGFFTTNPLLNNVNIQLSWTVVGGSIIGSSTGNTIEVLWDENLSTDGVVSFTYVSGLCSGTISESFYSGPCEVFAQVSQIDRSCEYAPILSAEGTGGTGPYTYLWQSIDGSTYSLTDNLDMSNLTSWSDNVVLTVTDANGCEFELLSEVSQFVTDLHPLPNVIDPSTILNYDTYYLEGEVLVNPGNGNLTYLGSKTIIALPNSSIKLVDGAKIQISMTHIFACKKMWKGIDAKKGASIVVSRNSLIEDAEIGVHLGGGCQYQFQNSVFNLNGTAIKIENSAIGQSQQQEITDMVFTRHNFISTSPLTNAANWFVTLASNTNLYNLTSMPIDALKPRVSGPILRPLGIEVTGTSSIKIGDETNFGNNNIFEALDNGIVTKNCSFVTVVNNTFSRICRKHAEQINPNGSSLGDFGVAINAIYKDFIGQVNNFNPYTAIFSAGIYNNNIAKNIILNCTFGIRAKNFSEVKINNNFFECSRSFYSGIVSSSTRITGSDAIVVSTINSNPSASTTNDYTKGISYNTIKVWRNAITFNKVFSNGSYYTNDNLFYIAYNSIAPGFTNMFSYNANTQVENGITLLSNIPSDLATHRTIVRNNSILRVAKNGISVSNFKSAQIINNADITTYARPNSNNGVQIKTCININNSTKILVNNNCNVGIDQADAYNLTLFNNIDKYRGLRLENSIGCSVRGNTFKNLGTCMRFEGFINTSNSITNNIMANSKIGIYLNNDAFLGSQALNSDPTRGSNNIWQTNGATSWQYAGFAEPLCIVGNSRFAFKINSGYESALNGTRNPLYNGNTLNYQLGYIDQTANYLNFTGCGSGGNPPPGGYVYYDTTMVDIDEEQMEEIIDNLGTEPYENQEADMFYFLKQNLHQIAQDSSVLQNPIIAEYYATLIQQNVGKVAKVEKELYMGDIESAVAINNSIYTTNNLELMHKFANQENYKLYKLNIDSTFTDSANLAEITALALDPVYENTSVGAMAKSLYINYFMKNATENYIDETNGRFAGEEFAEIENDSEKEQIVASIMPNPADNAITLVLESENAWIEVYDMHSKQLLQLKTSSKSTQIDTQAWSQGIYTFKIRTYENVFTKKVVIKH